MQEPLEGISFGFDIIFLLYDAISLWYDVRACCISNQDARPWCFFVFI